MDIKKFDFDLPEELIALYPAEKRDESRLMIVDRKRETIEISKFSGIVELFNENDLLIMNNSKVINARINLIRETGGKVEFLLLEHSDDFKIWTGICNRTKKIKVGDILKTKDEKFIASVIDKKEGKISLKFNNVLNYEELSIQGEIPLPPYIANKRNLVKDDNTRYQTVYAKNAGSLASPTAGLHFTDEILNKLKAKNVSIVYITLHVSLGTFLPIKEEKIERHRMHKETYFIDYDSAKKINNFLQDKNKRITCVGTTSIRTIESELLENPENLVNSGMNSTDIYIYPGFSFKGTDRLITNFHTPKSTPLLLVSAFASRDLMKKAYNLAIKEKFRFYSYGDSMIIL